ncbi:MAG: hypothetical protein ABIW81_07140 [Terrimesophilobacter sp.]
MAEITTNPHSPQKMSSGNSAAPHCWQRPAKPIGNADGPSISSGPDDDIGLGAGAFARSGAVDGAMALPHSPQNIAPAGSVVEQYEQIKAITSYRLNKLLTL